MDSRLTLTVTGIRATLTVTGIRATLTVTGLVLFLEVAEGNQPWPCMRAASEPKPNGWC
jgi:hypothetical protein